MNKTAEQIWIEADVVPKGHKASDSPQAFRRRANVLYRRQDGDLFERALAKLRRQESEGLDPPQGLEYCYALERLMTEIANKDH